MCVCVYMYVCVCVCVLFTSSGSTGFVNSLNLLSAMSLLVASRKKTRNSLKVVCLFRKRFLFSFSLSSRMGGGATFGSSSRGMAEGEKGHRYTEDMYVWQGGLHIYILKISVWLGAFMLQNLETALAGGLGQMSLVNDYQMFRPNPGSSSVIHHMYQTLQPNLGSSSVVSH